MLFGQILEDSGEMVFRLFLLASMASAETTNFMSSTVTIVYAAKIACMQLQQSEQFAKSPMKKAKLSFMTYHCSQLLLLLLLSF